jgi:hypothetical protein
MSIKPIPLCIDVQELSENEKSDFDIWANKHLDRMPTQLEYLSYRVALSTALSLAERPIKKLKEAPLKKLSDSIENMEEYTKLMLAAEVATRSTSAVRRLTDKSFNAYLIRDLVVEILDTACEVAYEQAEEPVKRANIDRDAAVCLVNALKDVYQTMMCKDPSPHKNTPFYNLVQNGLDAIGYPSADPENLLKDCFQQKDM